MEQPDVKTQKIICNTKSQILSPLRETTYYIVKHDDGVEGLGLYCFQLDAHFFIILMVFILKFVLLLHDIFIEL